MQPNSDRQLIDKQHEVFCMQRDYDRAFANYRRREQPSYSSEEILFIAKAAFQNEDYQRTLQLLTQLNPCQSTKVLFERQSLLFRALYLRERREYPKEQLFKTLYEVVVQFQKCSKSTPGPPLQKHHLERMQGYREFVAYLEKHSKSKINYNEKMHEEMLEQEKRTHKRTGFPCYFVSQQWLDDYNDMRYQASGKVYLGPITNFAIINDIFEAYHYESPLHQHKNIYLFPTTKYKLFSKKMWTFLCGLFAGDNQFSPVRRLYRQKSSYYQTTPEIVELVPAVINCDNQLTVFQLTANELVSKELLALLDQKHGLGELGYHPNEEASFEYFYGAENFQKTLAEWKKVLSYKRVQLPDKLINFPIFRHFDYRPLKISVFSNPKNGLKGLQNLGNSCYMNSCLQCISFTREAVLFLTTQDTSQLLLSKQEKRQNKTEQSNRMPVDEANGQLTIAMADLLKQLWRQGQQKFVSPFKFKKYFGMRNTMFQGKTQEDAHQFLLHLLNTVHEDIKQPGNLLRSTSKLQATTNVHRVKDYFIKHELQENKSMITDLFRGILHTSIRCNKCKTASHSFDLFLALSLPIPYVPSQTLKIYFNRQGARNTILYEIGLRNIKSMNDIFKVFQTEVFDVMRQSEAQGQQRQPEGEQERRRTEEDVPKKNYLLLGFSKESGPLEIWNCGFGNALSSKEVTVDELIALGRQLILYEVKERKTEEQQLVLLEYKMNFVLSKAKALGFPRLCYISRSIVLGDEKKPLKKAIVEKDTQNRLYESDFEDIERSKIDNKGSIKWTLTAYFRREERLFLGSTFVDRELNLTSEIYPLRDCFAHMGQPQFLEDGWKCGHCHSNEGAEKRESIIETNNILVLCLKRFQANGSKIKNMIDYPVSGLDVTEWLEERTEFGRQVYDLYGVCLHQGTMEYGHYRAYCRHLMSGQWFEFDDERVRKVQDVKEIVSQNAYMLFYKRRDI